MVCFVQVTNSKNLSLEGDQVKLEIEIVELYWPYKLMPAFLQTSVALQSVCDWYAFGQKSSLLLLCRCRCSDAIQPSCSAERAS